MALAMDTCVDAISSALSKTGNSPMIAAWNRVRNRLSLTVFPTWRQRQGAQIERGHDPDQNGDRGDDGFDEPPFLVGMVQLLHLVSVRDETGDLSQGGDTFEHS